MVRHYFNLFEPLPENPDYVQVECCYLFDWDAFDDDDWRRLREIYTQLPGYVNADPMWFGSDESNPPFLWASEEMARLLQVYGIVRRDDWQAWDSAFQAAAEGLPTRD